jgi:hypothetical protein
MQRKGGERERFTSYFTPIKMIMLHKSKERDFPWQLRGAISLSSPRLNSLFLFDSSLAIFRDMIFMRARRHYYYYRRHRTNGSITEGRT